MAKYLEKTGLARVVAWVKEELGKKQDAATAVTAAQVDSVVADKVDAYTIASPLGDQSSYIPSLSTSTGVYVGVSTDPIETKFTFFLKKNLIMFVPQERGTTNRYTSISVTMDEDALSKFTGCSLSQSSIIVPYCTKSGTAITGIEHVKYDLSCSLRQDGKGFDVVYTPVYATGGYGEMTLDTPLFIYLY